MNKHCEKYFGLMEDLITGEELDRQRAAQAESHIFDCSECRREYELLRREKEVFAHYLYAFEPQPNSLTNFKARLVEENELTPEDTVVPANSSGQRKRMFVFGFAPAFAAVLLFFGINFIWLKNEPFAEGGDKRLSKIKPEALPSKPAQTSGAEPKSTTDIQVKTDGAAADDNEQIFKNQSLRSGNNSFFGRKPPAAETVKIKQKIVSPGVKKIPANETAPDRAAPSATTDRRNLEAEIAGQIEKIELLLRSFRNARATGDVAGFDVEYEKRQARKLLETNAALRRDAETYGVFYGEELLSRTEPYLLEIANLEDDPAPEKVLDIRERVSSQNIIASLQVYSRDLLAQQ